MSQRDWNLIGMIGVGLAAGSLISHIFSWIAAGMLGVALILVSDYNVSRLNREVSEE